MEGLDSLPLMPFDMSSVQRSDAFTVAVDTSGLLGASVVPPLATLGVSVEDVIERVLAISVQAEVRAGEEEVVAEPASVQVRFVGGRSRVTAVDTDVLVARVAPELLQGMAAGEERIVPVRLEGVPTGVTALPLVDRVRVRRAIDEGGGPGVGGPGGRP